MTYYYVQSKDKDENIITIGHSEDEETKEVNYKFIDKGKAKKLIDEEKKSDPNAKYRIVKVIERIEVSNWQ